MTTGNSTGTRSTGSGGSIVRLVWIILFAIVELLLTARLAFKLLGADPLNVTVKSINNITQAGTSLFEGIIPQPASIAIEPSTVITMAVAALIFWVVLKLINARR